MLKKWNLMIAGVLLAMGMTACGTDNSEEASSGETSGTSGDSAAEESASSEGNASEEDANGESTEAEEITVSHELGETTVPKNPEDVVVFDFGSLDTLDTLGVDVAGLPKGTVPGYLSQYDSSEYENAGGIKEPDFEKIAAMEPGLIIISGRQSGAYEELSEIAPTIYMQVDTQNYWDSFASNAQTLGEIFGESDQVDEKLASIEDKVESLEEEASSADGEALVALANNGELSAYGAGSRFGVIHDEFGFAQVDENIETSTHGQSVSFEYVKEKNPEYLFVIDRTAVVGGDVSAEEVIENELTEQTKAYKNDNIVYLNPEYWYISGGGLQSVPAMVEQASAALE
ncbi:iron complex transport system substrate-binding protein [Salibacterium qingdaonense]|uniref:Iron complex transport system substrate-binding protein n=1 Tax=Salibacterium qingdaonense TaxID=266892 RepID=A0A1I4LXD0_9BACI|nr:siderophore ABC transporter substrate-binding protein [Salibacterium qingdaonense]SFL95559.1 iron complex transport system substrate-binding protein [Salibacterium qingdaonense]